MAELAGADYVFLILLKTAGRELSNTEMDKQYGFRLLSGPYERLNAAGYVSSDTARRPYRHSITKAGLDVLKVPLSIDQDHAEPGEKRSLRERLLWAGLVAQQNENVRAPVAGNAAAPADLDGRIRVTYAKLASVPGEWVDLTALRPLLADVSKADLDKALTRMLDASDVRLEPEPFGHRVGAEERRAAVHIGGEDRHKLAIGL
ncbi:hypothetical protein ACFY36_10065 [Actinoplanes sp. NPDC000266]